MLKSLKQTLQMRHPDVALVILVSLAAGWAFVLRPSLPRGTDTELHVFRAAELGYALRAGVIFPRWAADYYYGYGYPIFNYYAPLTYYLANLFSLALPGGAVFGVKMVFIAGYLCAGVGTYGFVRRYAGSSGGLIAAACYLFSPYVFLIDPHIRGVLAEFFAISLLPLVFWSVDTFFESVSRKHLLLSSFLVAALLLSHNLMGLIGFGMVAAFSLWAALFSPTSNRTPGRFRRLLVFSLPALSGLLLSAFFWLPVMLEQDAVQLGNLIGPGHFDYRNHFLSLAELFGASIPLDLGAANPAFRFNLGVGQWILALTGIAAFPAVLRAIGRGEGSSHRAYAPPFWFIGLAVSIFLMLPASQPIWDVIPAAAFLQFPWRLLGPASLCTAILAGYSATLSQKLPIRIQSPVNAAVFLLPMLFSLPVFVPRQWGSFGPTDQLAMLDFELSGTALGTTSTGDYLPIEVDVVPGPNPDLIASYRQPGPIDKVNRRTLPEGTSVEIVRHRPTLDLLAVQSGERFTLRLYTFMFDGWRASVDGQPVAIEVAKPEGFITVPVPAGEHAVKVWLGPTPPRIAGGLISLISLVSLLAAPLVPSEFPLGDRRANKIPPPSTAPFVAGFLLFAALASIGGWLALFQPRSTGLSVALAEYRSHHYLEGGVDLLAYDLPTTSVTSGTSFPLTLYWKAREPVGGNYQVFVHLTTIPQHTWGQSDKLNPGDLPTSRWTTLAYVRDPHTLTIPPGTPPGDYTLRVGLWNQATGGRQLVLAGDGQILGDSIELPTPITVRPASHPPSIDLLPVQTRLNVEIEPDIILVGAALQPRDGVSAEMGYLTVTLYWQAIAPIDTSYLVALRLVDGEGSEVDRASSLPADGLYPTSVWSAGEIVRDVHSFWIGPSLPDGEYAIELGMVGPDDNAPGAWTRISTFQRTNDD
jgi:hypothetical protein